MPAVRPFLRGYRVPTSSGVITSQRERTLYQQLQAHNANEVMSTYDISTDSWIAWTRPVRVLHSGAMTAVAASGFLNLANSDEYRPPICPHASDLSKDPKYSVMELHLRRKYQGRVVDYFQVPRASHVCPYVVVIPPLQPPHILFSQQTIDEHCIGMGPEDAADAQEVYRYDKDFLQQFSDPSNSSPSKASTSSVDEVEGLLYNFAGSSSASQSRASSVDIKEVPLFTLAPSRNHPTSPNFNPRVLPSLSFGLGPRPKPQPISAKRLASTRSFFTEEVSIARSKSDTSLITDLFYNDKTGIYQDNPHLHPAWDASRPPLTLCPYDERIYPNCTNCTFQHVDYFTTPVGQAIRELNSTLGLPASSLEELVAHAVKCEVCFCIFSVDGYNRHIVNGACGNAHFTSPVSRKEADVDNLRNLKLRTFTDSAVASNAQEILENPIGIAFLEFNSKLGVPMDVWATISTAYINCKTCHLSRTFPGHKAHLNAKLECHDLGEEGASLVKGKGKGKEGMAAAKETSVTEKEVNEDNDRDKEK